MKENTYDLAGVRLVTELIGLKPENLPQYLARNSGDLFRSDHPFADYMRMKFKEKGIQQQEGPRLLRHGGSCGIYVPVFQRARHPVHVPDRPFAR